ncbi:hypothetical protein Ddc_12168 [Ditylenchus destructor]|nr:hypothetical protein Ddc_12168 [Ditylenchus destructor]
MSYISASTVLARTSVKVAIRELVVIYDRTQVLGCYKTVCLGSEPISAKLGIGPGSSEIGSEPRCNDALPIESTSKASSESLYVYVVVSIWLDHISLFE